jgi:small subunit ribosomal protein S1
MKVKLIIVDTFDYEYAPPAPHYFFTEDHITQFVYSPPQAARRIETIF